MKLPRRQFLHLAAGSAALAAVLRTARAQAYPGRDLTRRAPPLPRPKNSDIRRLKGSMTALGQNR